MIATLWMTESEVASCTTAVRDFSWLLPQNDTTVDLHSLQSVMFVLED